MKRAPLRIAVLFGLLFSFLCSSAEASAAEVIKIGMLAPRSKSRACAKCHRGARAEAPFSRSRLAMVARAITEEN